MSDVLAAVRWWAALTLLGLAALPLLYTLLRRLPDRGLAFMRPAGLLLVGYVFWLSGSLGLAGNDGGGILLAILVVAALSAVAYRRLPPGDTGITVWLRENLTTVVVTELVFLVIFALWVYARAQNPAISATEKPMEFAFLNGVGRSPTFPPLDPWLSGYAISYYYFGYVMTSLLARLAFVAEPVAFNLAIAWLVAGTATGALGVVYNLVALRNDRRPPTADGRRTTNDGQRTTDDRRPPPEYDENYAGSQRAAVGGRWSAVSRQPSAVGGQRSALLMGVIAAVAVALAGNLQIGLEALHGNGVGPDALWAWLDVRDISGPAADTPRYESADWWWWRSSRVIHEYHLSGRAEEGLEPIVEAPSFSFILGDLHPHVLALPFAFLSMAVALAWYLELRVTSYELRVNRSALVTRHSSLVTRLRSLVTGLPPSLLLFTAVVLGGLSFLNTWDVGIYLFLVLGAYFLAHWLRAGTARGLLGRTALLAVGLVAAVVVLYLPFYLGFRSQAGAPFILPFLMHPTRLVHYLIIFGMPLLVITILLITVAARHGRRHWKAGVGAAVALVAGLALVRLLWAWLVAAGPDSGRIMGIAQELGLALPARPEGALAPLWGVQAVAALLPSLLAARLAAPWLVGLLAGYVALVVMSLLGLAEEEKPQISQMTQIEEEEAHAKDAKEDECAKEEQDLAASFSSLRLAPTLRSWREVSSLPFILLLILTGVLLTLGPEFVYLRDNFGVRLNTTFKFYYQAWAMFGVAAVAGLDYLLATRRSAASRVAAGVAAAGYLALLAVALLFPVLAVRSRSIEYRGAAQSADGEAQERRPATLDGLAGMAQFNPEEYEALQWLRAQTVDGPPPVVLEAVGGQYSGYGRVAASTGLPTLLGWPGHELQWRGSDHPEPSRREPIVEQIYTARDLGTVGFLLDQFDVAYIYVGDLERQQYGEGGLAKFAEGLEVAFANDRVTIYRWQPAAQ